LQTEHPYLKNSNSITLAASHDPRMKFESRGTIPMLQVLIESRLLAHLSFEAEHNIHCLQCVDDPYLIKAIEYVIQERFQGMGLGRKTQPLIFEASCEPNIFSC
jgi:hypothetical protein